MSERELHPELQALFDEHASPTHASRDDVHAQLVPIVTLAALAQRQMAEYRHQVTLAFVAPHDHELDGKMEHILQTLARAERDVAELAQLARNVAVDFNLLDQHFEEWRKDVEQWKRVGSDRVPMNPGDPPLAPDAHLYETAPS